MNKEKRQQTGHLIAGLITLVHGFDAFEEGDFTFAAAYLGLAILFLLVAGAHKAMIRQFVQADTAFFFLESSVIFYSGWHYKHSGHTYLFFAMMVAAVFFFVFALMSLQIDDRPRRRSRHRRRRGSRSSSSPATTEPKPE